jgi:hypothetical protein
MQKKVIIQAISKVQMTNTESVGYFAEYLSLNSSLNLNYLII